jgi:hypothetical protein
MALETGMFSKGDDHRYTLLSLSRLNFNEEIDTTRLVLPGRLPCISFRGTSPGTNIPGKIRASCSRLVPETARLAFPESESFPLPESRAEERQVSVHCKADRALLLRLIQ